MGESAHGGFSFWWYDSLGTRMPKTMKVHESTYRDQWVSTGLKSKDCMTRNPNLCNCRSVGIYTHQEAVRVFTYPFHIFHITLPLCIIINVAIIDGFYLKKLEYINGSFSCGASHFFTSSPWHISESRQNVVAQRWLNPRDPTADQTWRQSRNLRFHTIYIYDIWIYMTFMTFIYCYIFFLKI